MNKAIERASGKYICVLHSDDTFFDDYTLSKIAEKFVNEKIDVLYGDAVFVNKKIPNNVTREWKSRFLKPLNFFGWMPAHFTTLFIKKKSN